MSDFFQNVNLVDRKIVTAVSMRRSPGLTFLMQIFTESGRGYAWMVYALILNLLLLLNINLIERQDLILKAMFAPILGWWFGKIIKLSVKRKRPFQRIENFKALTHSPIDDSFPSLHASSSSSFCTALFLFHHFLAPWILIWCIMVSFSRLYLGVHYLSDLIAGIMLGIFCGCLIFAIF